MNTEVVLILSLEGHPFPESRVWPRSRSMWPERWDLSGMMWTRLEQSQQCQVQPEWRGGFGGWLFQTRKISRGEWGLTSWMRLTHHEEGYLSGVTSPEAWLIRVKEVIFWKGGEECMKRYRSVVSYVSWVSLRVALLWLSWKELE